MTSEKGDPDLHERAATAGTPRFIGPPPRDHLSGAAQAMAAALNDPEPPSPTLPLMLAGLDEAISNTTAIAERLEAAEARLCGPMPSEALKDPETPGHAYTERLNALVRALDQTNSRLHCALERIEQAV